MASKELIEKVAKAICHEWGYVWDGDEDDAQTAPDKETAYDERPSKELFRKAASSCISTILDALQEPTEHMLAEAEYLDRPIYVWRAMLAASALGEQSE